MAHLGQAAADAGQAFDGGLGVADGPGRVFEEVVVQGGVVVVESVALAGPVEPADPLEAAVEELIEVALYGAERDAGEMGDAVVGQALALEPEDVHLELDARVRVVEPVVADLGDDVIGEGERAHGSLPPGSISSRNNRHGQDRWQSCQDQPLGV